MLNTDYEVEFGVPIQIPMIDVRTIGAGGGSIAWIDKGGMLRVGPESAALFGLMMLMYTQGGRSYSVSEMRQGLSDAGFPSTEHVLVGDQRFSLLVSR